MFIPALWFHNVLTLEPSISINVFWKHLQDEYYSKKDLYAFDKKLNSLSHFTSILIVEKHRQLREERGAFISFCRYGNKDLVLAEKAMEQLDNVIKTIQQLPEYYREFYVQMLITQLKSKIQL